MNTRFFNVVALTIVLTSYVVLLLSVNRDDSGALAPIGFLIGISQ